MLTAHKGRLTEMFIGLANAYNMEDLSIFAGVDFD